MSEEDETGQDKAPAPHAEDLRWLQQTIGEPRVAHVKIKPTIPPGLDGGASSSDRFVSIEPENISEPKIDADPITNEIDEIVPVNTSTSDQSTMVVIDLDVSVGIDDPDILAGITIVFSGLPEGASLTAGKLKDDNTWVVPASLLDDLSIIITEDTGDFELVIVMDSGDGEPQSATMYVENNPSVVYDGPSFSMRLLSGPGKTPVRLFVYLDGSIAFDRVLTWPKGDEVFTSIAIPKLNDAVPFEILMRYDVIGINKNDGPILVGIDLENTHISSGSPAISVQGHINDQGVSWQGDLIVDVQGALKSATNIDSNAPATPETLPLNSDDTEPLLAIEPSGPADNPAKELEDSDIDSVLEPEETVAETIEQIPSDILFVDASLDDLKSPAFVDELRSLRDFIRGKSSDSDREVYERLGVDVSKWRDMSVRGPMGSHVDLDPAFPSLAPLGGRDNTRAPQKIQIRKSNSKQDVRVRISGLSPGALLTHGRNLGDGTWELTALDAENVSVLPEITQSKTACLQISWQVWSSDGYEVIERRSVLSNTIFPQLKYGNTVMRTMSLNLEADIFDPEGHGALSITVGDMPPGTMLFQGKNHGGGVWTFETTSGAEFKLSASTSMSPFSITLTCVALDSDTGNSTVASHTIKVDPHKGVMAPHRTLAA